MCPQSYSGPMSELNAVDVMDLVSFDSLLSEEEITLRNSVR